MDTFPTLTVHSMGCEKNKTCGIFGCEENQHHAEAVAIELHKIY